MRSDNCHWELGTSVSKQLIKLSLSKEINDCLVKCLKEKQRMQGLGTQVIVSNGDLLNLLSKLPSSIFIYVFLSLFTEKDLSDKLERWLSKASCVESPVKAIIAP